MDRTQSSSTTALANPTKSPNFPQKAEAMATFNFINFTPPARPTSMTESPLDFARPPIQGGCYTH